MNLLSKSNKEGKFFRLARLSEQLGPWPKTAI